MNEGGYRDLPLVYSCSGCSSAAQLANSLAVHLDHEGLAEMSCIAGVGGDVRPLVRLAKKQRPILALDGCSLHCVRHALARHQVIPDVHLDFSEAGVEKERHRFASEEEALRVWNRLVIPALTKLDDRQSILSTR